MVHAVRVFWNGHQIAERSALELLDVVAEAHGHERRDWINSWLRKHRDAQAREYLEQISGGQLEIQVMQ
jgi:hypothetical protein